jgi:hypothetical protein
MPSNEECDWPESMRWLGWMFARAEDIDRIIDGCAD